MTDEMNRAIRAAAGREPPKQSARVDSGSEAEPGAAGAERYAPIRRGRSPTPDVLARPSPPRRVQALPMRGGVTLGERLRGESVEEIRADAREFAAG